MDREGEGRDRKPIPPVKSPLSTAPPAANPTTMRPTTRNPHSKKRTQPPAPRRAERKPPSPTISETAPLNSTAGADPVPLQPVVIDRDALDATARMELAMAEVATGAPVNEVTRATGIHHNTLAKAVRTQRRDEYAADRDENRLRVINRMYDTLQAAVDRLDKKIPKATQAGLLEIVNTLAVRLAALENNRVSVSLELDRLRNSASGVQRTRQVVETIHAAGALSDSEQVVLDKMLGTKGLPSRAAPAPGGTGVGKQRDDDATTH